MNYIDLTAYHYHARRARGLMEASRSNAGLLPEEVGALVLQSVAHHRLALAALDEEAAK